MENIESSMESIEHVADALRLVIEIEGSEVNEVFGSVVAASGSDFVRCLLVFQTTVEKHIGHICDEIPKLEPDLAEECRELSDRFFVCAEQRKGEMEFGDILQAPLWGSRLRVEGLGSV